LAKVGIQEELARRRADVAARNGIKPDDIVGSLKRLAFTDITEVMGSPREWPEEAKAAVKHYDAGGPQSSEKVRLYDSRRRRRTCGTDYSRSAPDSK